VGGWLVRYWAGDAYYPPRSGGALLAGWAEIGLAGPRLFFFLYSFSNLTENCLLFCL
jgi:hypothetical protein